MSENKLAKIGWIDLTVPDADGVRDFYKAVVGWETMGIDMGGYQDYCMLPPGSQDAVAGICHARGSNADMPPVWMIYITVPDVDAAVAAACAAGGSLVTGPRSAGGGRFAVVRDPAGALFGLYGYSAEKAD